MANPVKGEVSFDAGGAVHTIRITANVICSLESELGAPFGEIGRRLNDLSFRSLRAAIRVGLGGKMTLDQAGEIIDQIGNVQAATYFMQAYDLAFPTPKEDDGNPPKGGEDGIGLSS
jgi:hypothetical protein